MQLIVYGWSEKYIDFEICQIDWVWIQHVSIERVTKTYDPYFVHMKNE